jgi:DNA-binding transcriptional LysR family regulator
MDLNAVQMFVNVVRAGSLSAAADRAKIPLPTLSRRIRELERQLRVQLLERSVRGTRLTDAGTRLYEYASRGIETLLEGQEAVTSDQARLKGRLRLSLPDAFEPWWELLSMFQKQYPDIHLHVYTTGRRVDLIEDGIDVALRVGTIKHEAMVARQLLAYRHVLVAGAQLIERLGLPESVDALHRFPCAVWTPAPGMPAVWRLGDQTFEPRSVLAANDYAHLRSRALAGEVITELPPFLAAPGIRAGELVALLRDRPTPEQQISLLYPLHRHPSAVVRAYLAFCQENVAMLTEACEITS